MNNLRQKDERPTQDKTILVDVEGAEGQKDTWSYSYDIKHDLVFSSSGETIGTWKDWLNLLEPGDWTPLGWRYLVEEICWEPFAHNGE